MSPPWLHDSRGVGGVGCGDRAEDSRDGDDDRLEDEEQRERDLRRAAGGRPGPGADVLTWKEGRKEGEKCATSQIRSPNMHFALRTSAGFMKVCLLWYGRPVIRSTLGVQAGG